MQLSRRSVLFQILQNGQVHKPQNPEQIFDLHTPECCMRLLKANTSVFLALCFREISLFEVRNVHKFPNIFYVSTEQQNTNTVLSVWNQNNKIWEMLYK
jgi:hypothetical protein